MLFLIAAGLHGLLPSPRSWNDLRLWHWLDYEFGLREMNVTQTEYEVEYRWLDRTLRIERWRRADVAAGVPRQRVWWAARHDLDDFELCVEATGCSSGDLVNAIGAVREDEMLGVRIERNGSATADGLFRIRGTKAVVLSELIRRYSVTATPFKLDPSQTHVWMYDDKLAELVYVPVEDAEKTLGMPIETRAMWATDRVRGGRVRAMKPSGWDETPARVTAMPGPASEDAFQDPPADAGGLAAPR